MYLEYEKCEQCGKMFLMPAKDEWAYKKIYDGRKLYYHKWSCMRAWEKKSRQGKKVAWYDMPEEDRKLLEDF